MVAHAQPARLHDDRDRLAGGPVVDRVLEHGVERVASDVIPISICHTHTPVSRHITNNDADAHVHRPLALQHLARVLRLVIERDVRADVLHELYLLVRAGGAVASTRGATAEELGRDDVTVTPIMAAATADKLAELLSHVASGKLRVNLEAAIPLERAQEALGAFADGTLGKVLITR